MCGKGSQKIIWGKNPFVCDPFGEKIPFRADENKDPFVEAFWNVEFQNYLGVGPVDYPWDF